MKIKPHHILLVLLMLNLAGCGLFRSTTKMEAHTNSTAAKNEVAMLAEHELLKANIPASYIKKITTPSGMKIELRDSIKAEQKRETTGGQRDTSDSKDSTESISEQPDPGFISIGFEQSKKQQDSTVTRTQKEQQQSEVQETEVETNGSWLTWILVGIAIALALAFAGMILLN